MADEVIPLRTLKSNGIRNVNPLEIPELKSEAFTLVKPWDEHGFGGLSVLNQSCGQIGGTTGASVLLGPKPVEQREIMPAARRFHKGKVFR
jgi:hypothetical protein